MSEASRVQRWRLPSRQHGLTAVTIWLTTEEELRLEDLALQGHCSTLWRSSRRRQRLVSVLQQICHRYVRLSGQSFSRCKQRSPLLQRPLQRLLQLRWRETCLPWCVSLWKGWRSRRLACLLLRYSVTLLIRKMMSLIRTVTLLRQRCLAYLLPTQTVTLLIQCLVERRQRRVGAAGHWARWVSALWPCSGRIPKASAPRNSARP
jgi:hypothetical protein